MEDLLALLVYALIMFSFFKLTMLSFALADRFLP